MYPLTPGEILCRGRKEKGLSAEEVMIHLGITHRTFDALEQDEYELLPSPLYVKGYIKRYCSILGISDTEVLVAFDAKVNELGLASKEPVVRLDGRLKGSVSRWNVLNIKIIVIAITAILLAVFVWLYLSGSNSQVLPTEVDEQPKPLTKSLVNNNQVEMESLSVEPLPEESLPIETIPSQYSRGIESSTDSVVESELESSNEGIIEGTEITIESSVDLTRDANVQPEVDQPTITKVAIAPDANVLQITVNQQSWIEVLDAKGDILLADLKTSGYQGEVKGMAPFDVILGYAPGVKLILNGKKVEIPSIENDNTAKLKIGDKEEG